MQEERKGMQEKGNVSRTLLCDCLHIVFSRDMRDAARDMLAGSGGKPPFSARIYETRSGQWAS
jgi:hypothetical protein